MTCILQCKSSRHPALCLNPKAGYQSAQSSKYNFILNCWRYEYCSTCLFGGSKMLLVQLCDIKSTKFY